MAAEAAESAGGAMGAVGAPSGLLAAAGWLGRRAGCRIDGVRHDTGNKLGFLKAVVYFALRRPDIAEKFSEYLGSLGLEPSVKP